MGPLGPGQGRGYPGLAALLAVSWGTSSWGTSPSLGLLPQPPVAPAQQPWGWDNPYSFPCPEPLGQCFSLGLSFPCLLAL